jgi:predicted RNA binding protein YcfA (HicA-like mRNA interferase family)
MSGRLPSLRTRDIEKALKQMGFFPVRQKGSHVFFKHVDGRTTLVPRHGGEEIGRGLLYKILEDIQIAPEEFLKYL